MIEYNQFQLLSIHFMKNLYQMYNSIKILITLIFLCQLKKDIYFTKLLIKLYKNKISKILIYYLKVYGI